MCEKKSCLLFILLKIVAFYCSRIENSCKCSNSFISYFICSNSFISIWNIHISYNNIHISIFYIFYCFKQKNVFIYNFRSTSKRQNKLVPLSGRQEKALHVLLLAWRPWSINKTKCIFYSLFDKEAKSILIYFALIKSYHISAC